MAAIFTVDREVFWGRVVAAGLLVLVLAPPAAAQSALAEAARRAAEQRKANGREAVVLSQKEFTGEDAYVEPVLSEAVLTQYGDALIAMSKQFEKDRALFERVNAKAKLLAHYRDLAGLIAEEPALVAAVQWYGLTAETYVFTSMAWSRAEVRAGAHQYDPAHQSPIEAANTRFAVEHVTFLRQLRERLSLNASYRIRPGPSALR
jgi:hypothetical protein